ncbi:Rrf2 family transcriptional regulator [Tissierella creatinini]|nr:Rrf2 family transcriptional regulator [Tissierella creatinini]TJX69048.1 Rrf2 family transcriptional regulator [Soehngenia saccharolytica]
MKLSTKGRYGLMAMFQLALDYGQGPISLKYIAEKQELSENYLEQLFSNLRRDGLLNSVRGAQGGYMLSRAPKEITVGQVLRSLEGNLAPADCLLHDNDCNKEEGCATKQVMLRIKQGIDSVVDSITLGDMVEDSLDISQI